MADYPGIRHACFTIAMDNGGINRERSHARWHRDYSRWIKSQDGPLAEIDAWLTALTEQQLEIVCCGGEGEPEQVALMETAPAFTDDLLNSYFSEVC